MFRQVNQRTSHSQVLTNGLTDSLQRQIQSDDFYARLGIHRLSNQGIIRKAYFKLSKVVHPDRCRHPQAQVS